MRACVLLSAALVDNVDKALSNLGGSEAVSEVSCSATNSRICFSFCLCINYHHQQQQRTPSIHQLSLDPLQLEHYSWSSSVSPLCCCVQGLSRSQVPLFLSFRPDDPNCQPVGSRKRPCAGILLRCKRKKKECNKGEGEGGGKEASHETEGSNGGVEPTVEAEIVGTVDCAVEFCGEQMCCDLHPLQFFTVMLIYT